MAKVVIEVKKNGNENGTNLLRRFSRRVGESSIIPTVKGKRYSERKASKVSTKNLAFRRLARRKEMEKLRKLGKIAEAKPRR